MFAAPVVPTKENTKSAETATWKTTKIDAKINFGKLPQRKRVGRAEEPRRGTVEADEEDEEEELESNTGWISQASGSHQPGLV